MQKLATNGEEVIKMNLDGWSQEPGAIRVRQKSCLLMFFLQSRNPSRVCGCMCECICAATIYFPFILRRECNAHFPGVISTHNKSVRLL